MKYTADKMGDLLKGLEDTWLPNELAQLYCNSRTEMNIRDKFTNHFANQLKGNPYFFIQREWKRTDLTLIEYVNPYTQPAATFEFKARHTYHIAQTERGVRGGKSGYETTFYGDGTDKRKNGLKQDIDKLASYADNYPCYHILVGVHPLETIPEKYLVFKNDCKELLLINNSLNNYGSAAEVEIRCDQNVKQFCKKVNHDFIKLDYSIGEALDIEWKMFIWVMYKKNRLHIQ
ncbi:hypothetical protein [Bacillus sp. AG4(2022)]|uniref:hypothetical protein n=1 Tax=Bacillus sp. AG4(2022) TaxID=2962594 RepID=UPI00288196CF|nr:hypothetical protein [Bacillus sp. AG4(2022)]MDT0160653.1 hypothetical protein [Bacillus sp. AG4(2022)]